MAFDGHIMAFDGHIMAFDGHIMAFDGHIMAFDGHIMAFDGHIMAFDGHIMAFDGHIMAFDGHIMAFDGHIMAFDGHIMAFDGHIMAYYGKSYYGLLWLCFPGFSEGFWFSVSQHPRSSLATTPNLFRPPTDASMDTMLVVRFWPHTRYHSQISDPTPCILPHILHTLSPPASFLIHHHVMFFLFEHPRVPKVEPLCYHRS